MISASFRGARALGALACLSLSPALLDAQADTVGANASTWGAQPAVGVDTATLYFVRDGQRQLGMLYIETIRRVPEGFMLVQQNVRPNGASVTLDTVVLNEGTLAPVWHSDVTPRGTTRVSFAGGRVRGTATDTAGVESPVDAAVPAGAIDFSAASTFARLLPLRAGYAVVLRTYDIHRGLIYTPIRVLGEEMLDVGGTEVKAWKIETITAGQPVHHWIDQATRKELRVSLTMGPTTMIMERSP